MNKQEFIHLHVHTQYSLLDGACRINRLAAKAKEWGMPAIAITDHGNMFGVIEFSETLKKAGIKPIIGCEVYVAPKSRKDKGASGITDASFHLVLLAKDQRGYQNLIRLVSAGYKEGFYYRPRIDKELLAKYHEGLIALTACIKGEIPYLLVNDQRDEARKAIIQYMDIMGKDNLFLEIQSNGLKEQDLANKGLISLARELNLPLVATNDCHYIERQEAYSHEVLLCLQTGKTISDTKRMRMSTDQFYFRPPEEMVRLFKDIPEALTNTLIIAERCDFQFKFGQYYLPDYQPPSPYNLETYLDELSFRGAITRYDLKGIDPDEYLKQDEPGRTGILSRLSQEQRVILERLETELRVIKKMGFAGYFLVVWDFVHYSREKGIAVGPGRGSAAGSLVAYSLGITDIDPLAYDLLFERFLNPERVSMPDIDIDFCMRRRDEVINYVGQRYGQENVAQIITFGTMAAKGVVRDVGRVLEMPYNEVDRIAKLIPSVLNITLEEAVQQEEQLRSLIQNDQRVAHLFEVARVLEGLCRHASTHAAGIVISPKPLVEFLPLYTTQDKPNEPICQFQMHDIEKIGLLKMDFLGLRTLTVIQDALRLIKESRGEEVDLSRIHTDDEATFKLLKEGRTIGVFQLESSGMRDLLRRMKPDCFPDLIALVALYRPGPLGSGMVDDFIQRKFGKVEIRYDHPCLESILKETYGVIVYQEQVMKIASELAGFSLGDADLLRRAMGKKNPEVMAKQKDKFMAGAKAKNIDSKIAEKIYNLIFHFAGYGFNKSHSAAYALISYRTAYLKAHYEVEFMAALMTSEMEDTDKVVKFINEAKEMEISILPPGVNESQKDFTVSDGCIRFGLAAIKNVGENAVNSIIKARNKDGKFADLFDFCKRVDLRVVNKRVLESLVKAGALDSLGGHRAQLISALDEVVEFGQLAQKAKTSRQISLFDCDENKEQAQNSPYHRSLPQKEEWSDYQRLQYEKEVIGFFVTGHPLERYEHDLRLHTNYSTEDLESLSQGQEIKVGGLIKLNKEISTKKGDRMAFATLEDKYGVVEVVLFPEIYKKTSELIKKELPVLVKGQVDLKDEKVNLMADDITSLEELRKRSVTEFHVRLPLEGLKKEDLEGLHQILKTRLGTSSVYLHFLADGEEEIVLMADNNIRVEPSEELIVDIEKRWGKGAVRLGR